MGRGIINVPLREVAEYIKDVQNNMSWDDLLVVSVLLIVCDTHNHGTVKF